MNKTVRRAGIVYALIVLFLAGVAVIAVQFIMNGSDWATNKANQHIYSNGTVVNAGTITDRNGIVLAESKNNKRVFNDSASVRKAVLHIVGDTSGVISTGTHNLYRSNLSGYNIFDGILNLKRSGTGSAIRLNIDSKANKIAYEALGSFNGTLIVCNYKTGEILCSVSKPSYDVNYVPRDLRTNPAYEGVFLDKAVSAKYTPGSIMKIITAACAVENIPDIDSKVFECTGEYQTGDGKVICNGVHGKIDFSQALAQSCNCAFAQISIELGADKLLATAKSLGFNRHLSAKEVPLTVSRFAPSKTSKTELGWAGIGQSTTQVNPTHFLAIINAIANGGTGYSPDRIASMGIVGDVVGRMPEIMVRMNPQTAAKLKTMMRFNVTGKYGDWNFPGLEMCAKTGTAENDGKKSTSVFAGFSQKESLPLAVICFAEEAGWGSGTAMKASNTVLQYFLKNYE